MAIRKKGSRQITVEGNTFVWKIKKRASHNERHDVDYLIPIQHIGGGQILLAGLGYNRSGYNISPINKITPSVIERCIREAIAEGWQFNEKATPLKLDLAYLLKDEAVHLTIEFFEKVTGHFRNELVDKIVAGVDSLMQVGEYNIALEIVIDNLGEYEIKLSEELIDIADRALTLYGNNKYRLVLRDLEGKCN